MLRISDAASLALHTMVLLAGSSGKLLSNKEIASMLKVSEAHLSKVLQRLAKIGLVGSTRGPKGGFYLGKEASAITLMEVYEAIEGPLVLCNCLLDKKICTKKHCILGRLVEKVNGQVKEYLANNTLDKLSPFYKGC
ncbi:MAG: Rrf2 family transcriptional regulator [Candidatus Brocadiae bacterium]|nr:Rrf2 family transcriptional regulator [Candidatus Brocadiia bacterium]